MLFYLPISVCDSVLTYFVSFIHVAFVHCLVVVYDLKGAVDFTLLKSSVLDELVREYEDTPAVHFPFFSLTLVVSAFHLSPLLEFATFVRVVYLGLELQESFFSDHLQHFWAVLFNDASESVAAQRESMIEPLIVLHLWFFDAFIHGKRFFKVHDYV
jgi:hypothetical protein